MSAPRDLDGLLTTFLKEGPLELPDPSYDQVRDRIEHRRQRTFIGPWRTPDMNRYVKIGLAAAAVVVLAIIGLQYLGRNVGGPGSTATPEPTSSPDLRCCAPGDTSPVNPGPFLIWDDIHGGNSVTVTVQSSDWAGSENQHVLLHNNSFDPLDGAALFVFEGGDVPADPCAWLTLPYPETVDSVDGYVTALTSQASRDASAPVDITVAGHPGKAIILHVPDDVDFGACDQGLFVTLTIREFGNPVPLAARFAQGTGQIDEFWIVDVDGEPVLFDIAYGKATPQALIDEMRAMVESAAFGTFRQ